MTNEVKLEKEENKFFLFGGKVLESVLDLVTELKEMPDHIYYHHVRPGANDFACWLRHSIKDEKLANEIEGQISKLEMELKLLRHLFAKALVEKVSEVIVEKLTPSHPPVSAKPKVVKSAPKKKAVAKKKK